SSLMLTRLRPISARMLEPVSSAIGCVGMNADCRISCSTSTIVRRVASACYQQIFGPLCIATVDMSAFRQYDAVMSTLPEALPEPDPIAIAQRLRMYMGDKKLSRAQLAVGSGINRTSLGAKLDGDGRFTLDELLAISRALGRSWLWVMTGVDAPAPNA